MMTSKHKRNVHRLKNLYLRKFESSIIFYKSELMFYSFNANQFVIHGIHAVRIMDIEGC